MEFVAVDVVEHEIRRLCRDQRVSTQRFGPHCPQSVDLVVHRCHAEAVRGRGEVEFAGQRDAHIALARTFGFDLPAGCRLERHSIEIESIEDHRPIVLTP